MSKSIFKRAVFPTLVLVLTSFFFLATAGLSDEVQSPEEKAVAEEQCALSRAEKYLEVFKRVHGESEAAQAYIDELKEISPDLTMYLIEHPGEIYDRPGLSLRDREIATIAVLVALGNAPQQLGAHVRAGLRAGLTEDEIMEIVIQMFLYAGFPASLNGMMVVKEIFDEPEN
jgi:4-carboxymuconolactone decarboxylase